MVINGQWLMMDAGLAGLALMMGRWGNPASQGLGENGQPWALTNVVTA